MTHKLHRWHKTILGLLVFALVELGITYGFICLAIDRGNLLYYLLAFVFLVGSLQNLFKLIGKLFYDKKV
ncbi:MAG TPA: hypothetical protein VK712_00035 [Verrucomicrobiae bacterium]|jgi:hypothetical protein|nr:hypothetical protein [Verrucomicrobiae bacterium]